MLDIIDRCGAGRKSTAGGGGGVEPVVAPSEPETLSSPCITIRVERPLFLFCMLAVIRNLHYYSP